MILLDTDHTTFLKYPDSERGRRMIGPGPTLRETVRAATSHRSRNFIKNFLDVACVPCNCERPRAMKLQVVGV
jgi:hypothetical protein